MLKYNILSLNSSLISSLKAYSSRNAEDGKLLDACACGDRATDVGWGCLGWCLLNTPRCYFSSCHKRLAPHPAPSELALRRAREGLSLRWVLQHLRGSRDRKDWFKGPSGGCCLAPSSSSSLFSFLLLYHSENRGFWRVVCKGLDL